MINILVTGAKGFVGKNLIEALNRQSDVEIFEYDVNNTVDELYDSLKKCDFIYHLAGVNRPKDVEEFEEGNYGLTRVICDKLREYGRKPKIVVSSSIQAELDNPYGTSKKHAEEELAKYAKDADAEVVVYRLKNLFGKWCRPNYNSVIATFCYNAARDLPLQISDPAYEVDFTYIDDVVSAFIGELSSVSDGFRMAGVSKSYKVTLGDLAEKVKSFRNSRKDLLVPDFTDSFTRCLYATYLSYLETNDFAYLLDMKTDSRGNLAEFLKSKNIGQIFISHTHPGITRGNHYHNTKNEKFLVVQGEAIIRFRHINSDEVIEYFVSGEDYKVVDIPPGYTHSIENVGNTRMTVLFWASKIYDSNNTDTHLMEVIKQ